MTAMGAPWGLNLPAGSGPIREYLYVQMWVSFWAGDYTIGEMSDSTVRGLGARELFRSKAGRRELLGGDRSGTISKQHVPT